VAFAAGAVADERTSTSRREGGCQNWLFAGHDDAGRSHATLYTLIASAQRHGIDPHAYLRSVLAKIATTPVRQLDQFLPEKWKAEDEHSAPTTR
jgi:transposase